LNEDGRGGDYRMWLDERKHTRSDHKYALGEPLPFLDSIYDGSVIQNRCKEIEGIEFSTDLGRAMGTLTELQCRYFIMNRLLGYGYAEIARRENKHKVTVSGIVKAAEKKVKNFLT
jgi:DNA-directed RNA polymerase specialized sigma24 family protein